MKMDDLLHMILQTV